MSSRISATWDAVRSAVGTLVIRGPLLFNIDCGFSRLASESAAKSLSIPQIEEVSGAAVFEFALTPAQRELRDGVRAFAKAEVLPISAQSAAERSLPQSVADAWHATGFPRSYYDQPDEGSTIVADGAIISEELGYVDASFASYLMLPAFF